MSKSGGKTNAAAWQPTTQAASKSIFTSRPFPEIVQREQETAGNGEKAAQPVNRRGSILENINRSMAKNSIPAELNAPNVGVQAKLTIGEPGDQYEQEADRVAAEVVQKMNEPAAPRITAPPRGDGEEKRVLRKPIIPIVASRLSPGVEVPLMRQNGLKASPGPNVQTGFESKLNQARGGGGALDAAFRAKIEPAMGADFSRVRVHTDSGADEMSQSIQAKAFTTGQDVFFRQGAYEPGSRGGQELIAHELTHVVQQNGGAVMRSPLAPQQLSQHPATDRQIQAKMDEVNVHHNSSQSVQLNALAYTQGSLPSIQRKAITADELKCQEDKTGDIFDSKVKTGKKFSLETKTEETKTDASDREAAISAYTQAIRPVGNVAGESGYTDKKLTFQNNLPSRSKWGQKKASFVQTATQELKMPSSISVDTKPDWDYWQRLSNKAKNEDRSVLCNNDDIGLIDPFLVNVVVKNSISVAAKNWEFLTQFADSGTGYIIKIVNGTQEIEGNIATRNDFNSNKDEEVGGNTGYLYSSTHDQGSETFGARIDNSINGTSPVTDTKGSKSNGLDAITWLAAEGARFKPIENLGASGSPESCFFIKPNEDNWTGFKYLTAANLMQCWGEDFARKYGIETSKVSEIVTKKGKTDKDNPPAGWHYNLSNDKKYSQD